MHIDNCIKKWFKGLVKVKLTVVFFISLKSFTSLRKATKKNNRTTATKYQQNLNPKKIYDKKNT